MTSPLYLWRGNKLPAKMLHNNIVFKRTAYEIMTIKDAFMPLQPCLSSIIKPCSADIAKPQEFQKNSSKKQHVWFTISLATYSVISSGKSDHYTILLVREYN